MSLVVDSSALVALLEDEPEAPAFTTCLLAAEARLVSAFTLVETLVVMLGRRGPASIAEARAYLDDLDLQVIPFDAHQAALAVEAYARFGKGIDPRARLNLGDCVAYALARSLGAPLLFKGGDFAATDIAPATPPAGP